MHEPGGGLALPDGHLERFDDELGAHVLGHRPADATARVAVDDDREVELALPSGDLGEVRRPQPILGRGREVATDEVGRRAHPGHADRGLAAPADEQARQARLAHQPRDPLAAGAHAARSQLGVHPRPPVAAVALVVDLADPRQQLAIAPLALADAAARPRVEAGARDAEHAAQQGDGCCARFASINRKHITGDRSPGRRKPRPP
jgi:hypothetical protein